MSVLLEVVVGAVLSFLVTTEEIEKNPTPEEVKTEQVSEVTGPVDCEEKRM